MIDMIYVDSSNIEAIGYNEETSELHVQFIDSGLYIFVDVPLEVYQELMDAPSKGSYFNREIKPVYSFTKE